MDSVQYTVEYTRTPNVHWSIQTFVLQSTSNRIWETLDSVRFRSISFDSILIDVQASNWRVYITNESSRSPIQTIPLVERFATLCISNPVHTRVERFEFRMLHILSNALYIQTDWIKLQCDSNASSPTRSRSIVSFVFYFKCSFGFPQFWEFDRLASDLVNGLVD